jgi:hypothetical protein
MKPCNITQLVPAVRLIHCIRTVKLKKMGLNIEFWSVDAVKMCRFALCVLHKKYFPLMGGGMVTLCAVGLGFEPSDVHFTFWVFIMPPEKVNYSAWSWLGCEGSFGFPLLVIKSSQRLKRKYRPSQFAGCADVGTIGERWWVVKILTSVAGHRMG